MIVTVYTFHNKKEKSTLSLILQMSYYYPAPAQYARPGHYTYQTPVTSRTVAQQPVQQPLVHQPMVVPTPVQHTGAPTLQPMVMGSHVLPAGTNPFILSPKSAEQHARIPATVAQGLPKTAQVKLIKADQSNPSYANGQLLEQGAASVRRRGSKDNISPQHHNPEVLVYPEDPISAVELLRAGNERFTRGEVLAPNRNMDRVKNLAGGQHPFAAFLSCADSRVPVEILFDQGFGDIFVVRVAGNVSNPEVVGSLEFGTSVLGAKVLYVLGHTACGAVKAAGTCEGEDVPGLVSSLFYHVKPALRAVNGDINAAIGENVKLQAQQLAEVSPIIRTLIRQKKLIVVGGVYDLESGEVKEVCQITDVPHAKQ
uniref:carbonic anhydrase n=1 Tax=Chromera velia CCMP2878 TaxID=1169474 RepID=A0A0G4IBN8_9ALVE|eukprot:Cvel_12812.t1-p1 / transcript=Cvel_12812.t1 / gene=Cvel_12812 / organism=Chromera_velia_CCMP2878 / gene_product=Carbonic anhydrase, putative / transcript_product=Carbonic anhydrase, putative / location=Cvel_scaffold854:9353-11539(-) / protein_length=368 / sequence_SO=supercontig / SO=protein_coding / is_pseudo=false